MGGKVSKIVEDAAAEGNDELNLEDCQLSKVPKEIFSKFPGTRVLNLNKNQLSRLSKNVGDLRQLTTLLLTANSISELPHELANCVNLTILKLQSNKVGKFPAQLCSLAQLTELDLYHNKLSSLPNELHQLRALKKLVIQGNSISTFPDDIGTMLELRWIYAANNHLKALPDSITALANLRLLHVGSNRLKALPPNMGALTALVVLNVSENKIGVVIPDLANLVALEELLASGMGLTAVPAGLEALHRLRVLDLSKNKIPELTPAVFRLTTLQELHIARNPISGVLPAEIRQLQELRILDIAETHISEFPLDFIQLKKLETLLTEGCSMTVPPTQVVRAGLEAVRDFLNPMSIRRGSVKAFTVSISGPRMNEDRANDMMRRYVRRWQARHAYRRADTLRQNSVMAYREVRLKEGAATQMQRIWRGYLVRKKLGRRGKTIVKFTPGSIASSVGALRSQKRSTNWDESTLVCVVNGIKLEVMIDKFTTPGATDSELLHVFLMTHTNILPSVELLDSFIACYHTPPAGSEANEVVLSQRRVLEVLTTWVEAQIYDFAENHALGTKMSFFLATAAESPHGLVRDACQVLQAAYKSNMGRYSRLFTISSDAFSRGRGRAPRAILPTVNEITSVLDVHPLELARQISLIDFGTFVQIRPKEYLRQAWTKVGKEQRAPNLLLMIDRFNDVSAWAATEILKADGFETRLRIMCHLIETAEHCAGMHNYGSLMAILSAFHSAHISRMKQHLGVIPEEVQDTLNKLNTLMAIDHNSRTYREALAKAPAPAVPYLGMFLQDLTFVDDGNPDFIGAKLINLEKQRMTVAVVEKLMRLRSREFNLQPVMSIFNYLVEYKAWDATTLYNRSLEREPRGQQLRAGVRRTTLQLGRTQSITKAAASAAASPEDDAIDPQFIADLTHRMNRETYNAGEYIVRIGQPGTCMYFIIRGIVTVQLPDGDVSLNQGDFFGEIALFLPFNRVANVVAYTQVELLRLDKDVCDSVMKKYPSVHGQFMKLAQERQNKALLGEGKRRLPGWLQRIVPKAGAGDKGAGDKGLGPRSKSGMLAQVPVENLKRELADVKQKIAKEEKTRAGLTTLIPTYGENNEARVQVQSQINTCDEVISKLRNRQLDLERAIPPSESQNPFTGTPVAQLQGLHKSAAQQLAAHRKTKAGIETLIKTYQENTEARQKVVAEIAALDVSIDKIVGQLRALEEELARQGVAVEGAVSTPTGAQAGTPMNMNKAMEVFNRSLIKYVWRWRARKNHRIAARERYKALVEDQQRKKLLTGAAIIIQAMWRGYSFRRRFTAQGQALPRRATHSSSHLAALKSQRAKAMTAPRWDATEMMCEIHGMHLEHILARVLTPGNVDDELTDILLLTHSLMMKSDDLLDTIMARYAEHANAGRPEARRALEVLGLWVTRHTYDFVDDFNLGARMEGFLKNAAKMGTYDAATKAALEQLASQHAAAVANYTHAYTVTNEAFSRQRGMAPRSHLPHDTVYSILDMSAVEIARQLTLLDYSAVYKIRQRELLRQAWSKHGKELKAPNVLHVIEQFNETCTWAATEILRQEDAERRLIVLCHLLDVGEECLKLNNFNSLMAVVSALNSGPISRMKQHFEYLPPTHQEKLRKLNNVMDMRFNYAVYRDTVKKANGPAVPFIGLALQDLTFVDDGNPDTISKHRMVNVNKHRMTAKVIHKLWRLRIGEYCLQPVVPIYQYLLSADRWSQAQQYETSLLREPRGGKFTLARKLELPLNPWDDRPVQEEEFVDPQFIADIAHRMTRVVMYRGKHICKLGDVGHSMYFIVSGVVAVIMDQGQPPVLLNQGNYFGEIALFLSIPRVRSVRAHTDVVLLRLDKHVCDEILDAYPRVAEQFRQAANERLLGGTTSRNPKWLEVIAETV